MKIIIISIQRKGKKVASRQCYAIWLGIAGLGCAPLLHAEEDKTVRSLEAIEVKANHFLELAPAYGGNHLATGGSIGLLGNLDNMETPFSTVNYTSSYIEDQQGQELRILISKNDPSVQTPGSGGTAGKDTIYIRGFSAGDVYLNGMQGLTSGRRVMAMAERLEVLKGPSALLYGMNASGDVGGSINMVTKRATVDPITNFTATYMAPSQFGGHLDLGRRFGENNEFGLRLNTVFKDGEGMVDHRKNRDKFVSLGADYNGGAFRLKTDFYHLDEYISGVNRGISLAKDLQKNPLPSAPKGDVLLSAPWASAQIRENTAMARAEYDINDQVSAYASVGYSESSMHNYNTKGSVLLNDKGDLRLKVTRRHNQSRNVAANTGLFYEFDTAGIKHNLSMGVDWYRQNSRMSNTALKGWTADINIYNPVYPERPNFAQAPLGPATITELYSFGLADTLSFDDNRFRLILGLRHQTVKTHNRSSGVRYDKSALTPAIAGVWRLNEDWMVYANYIEGLTKGTQVGDDYANDGEIFPPQRTKQHEIGLKYDSGDYAITAALFQITQPNTYEVPGRAGEKPSLSYGGEQRNRGAEIQVVGQVTPEWRLTGGVAYLDPRYHKTSDNASRNNYVTNLSRWAVKLGAEWEPSFFDDLTLSAHLSSQSKQYLDKANSYYVPGVTTYDVGARYRTSLAGNPLTLRLSIENLTNKAYWVAPLSQGQGSPRTVLLSATMNF